MVKVDLRGSFYYPTAIWSDGVLVRPFQRFREAGENGHYFQGARRLVPHPISSSLVNHSHSSAAALAVTSDVRGMVLVSHAGSISAGNLFNRKTAFHCTQHFFITLSLPLYDYNTVERDIKNKLSIHQS